MSSLSVIRLVPKPTDSLEIPGISHVSPELANCIKAVRDIFYRTLGDVEWVKHAAKLHAAKDVAELSHLISNIVEDLSIPIQSEDSANSLPTHPNYIEKWLSDLRTQFIQGKVQISPELWEWIRKKDFFLESIAKYVESHIGAIFDYHGIESVYNEIEFAFFLLGAPEKLDIVVDLQFSESLGVKKSIIGWVLALHIESIKEKYREFVKKKNESSFDVKRAQEKVRIALETFIQLIETINRAISFHTIGKSNRNYVVEFAGMTEEALKEIIQYLDGESALPFSNWITRLNHELGRFWINYTHLEYFEGNTEEEINTAADRMCEKINTSLGKMWSANFLGKPILKFRAPLVAQWNIAYIRMLQIDKLRRKGFITDKESKIKTRPYLQTIRDIYSQEARFAEIETEFSEWRIDKNIMDQKIENIPKDVEKKGVQNKNSEEVLNYIMEHDKNSSKVNLETLHHLILLDNEISVNTLERLVYFLAKEIPYQNICHEESRVKTLSVILTKLADNPQAPSTIGDVVNDYLELAIREHSPLIEHSYAYLALALFYAKKYKAGILPEKTKKEAKIAFTHHYYLNPRLTEEEGGDEKDFFADEKKQLMYMIGDCEDFRNYHTSKEENIVREGFSRIITWINENEVSVLSEKNSPDAAVDKSYSMEDVANLVRKLFYNIPIAQERTCPHCKPSDASCRDCEHEVSCRLIPRGSLERKISYWKNGRHLLFLYPANMHNAFMRIFAVEQIFVHNRLTEIEDALQFNREKQYDRNKNAELEKKTKIAEKTKQLSGLPNKSAFETYLWELQVSKKNADFILLHIKNPDIFWSKAIKAFASSSIAKFLKENPKIQVFHLDDNEFIFTGDAGEITDIASFVADMKNRFKTYRFRSGGKIQTNNALLDDIAVPLIRIAYVQDGGVHVKTELDTALKNSDKAIITYEKPKGVINQTSPEKERGLRTAIEKAMSNHTIYTYAQEICFADVEKAKGMPRKFECLVCLFDENNEHLPLEECLRLAEKYELSKELTLYILERVCLELQGNPFVEISVNIYPNDFKSREFVDQFIAVTRKYGVEKQIIIEIVETPIAYDEELVINNLAYISDKGFRIAIDDYGKQSSGLERVEKMHPTYVKLDQVHAEDIQAAFNLQDQDDGASLKMKTIDIRWLVESFHVRGLQVVAEHVETREVANILRELGVDLFQWYLFSRPIPFDELQF